MKFILLITIAYVGYAMFAYSPAEFQALGLSGLTLLGVYKIA